MLCISQWTEEQMPAEQVWAYHSDKAATTPPQTGWKVPYDGPVDASFVIQPAGAAAPAQSQQQQVIERTSGFVRSASAVLNSFTQ